MYPLVAPGARGLDRARRRRRPSASTRRPASGRERVFEHASRERGTPCLLFRLFYAVDLRYGTLVDVARKVLAGEPVDLRVGHVNAIWQGDANSYAFRGLALCASPAAAAGRDGSGGRLGPRGRGALRRALRARGRASPASRAPPLLGDPSQCVSLLGPPEVSLARLLEWVASWVARGGRSLGKPTHFESTDGRF